MVTCEVLAKRFSGEEGATKNHKKFRAVVRIL